jgi:hypothetical protein
MRHFDIVFVVLEQIPAEVQYTATDEEDLTTKFRVDFGNQAKILSVMEYTLQ